MPQAKEELKALLKQDPRNLTYKGKLRIYELRQLLNDFKKDFRQSKLLK
ncbi:hypothetical protein JOD45_000200 [Scopulibacillus daqui]|uniref:Fur-regulated basic protein A n=1 Tax=Scopulibacillus daqui TaxID=1469162 RepID=A0ABS2PVC2_9BACL|nr:hypothetical protein [Scopulibacillus daqui]MBM7644009.1 hypothetical protein [Scopulibacillus daqui]